MEEIASNVYVETGYRGVNVGCILTEAGVICVDTPLLPGDARHWRARIAEFTDHPIRFVIYTSHRRDRVLGTEFLGGRPVAHEMAWPAMAPYTEEAFRQALVAELGEQDPSIEKVTVRLPEITFSRHLILPVDGQEIRLLHATGTALWVYVPEQRVLFAGDTIVVGAVPGLERMDLEAWLAALERLRQGEIAVELIVPASGPVSDLSVVEPMIAFLERVREGLDAFYQAGRPRAELVELIPDLLAPLALSAQPPEEAEALLRQGLEYLYEQKVNAG
ncbi:MAG: hypothetical protein D6759_04315 [Chloroflexi bacterium]|nr:MAG: hypothetical protein D6759_04315 [Chloroflexota bacterium]